MTALNEIMRSFCVESKTGLALDLPYPRPINGSEECRSYEAEQ